MPRLLLADEEIRKSLYKTEWKATVHKRVQYPRTNMNVHALYVNDKMFGYILDKPEDKGWFSIYKGDREYAYSTIAKHSLDEAKQALLDMATKDMELPARRNAIAKAELKKVAEWGNEDCPHLSVKYGGFPPRKHECKQCWQALLKEAE